MDLRSSLEDLSDQLLGEAERGELIDAVEVAGGLGCSKHFETDDRLQPSFNLVEEVFEVGKLEFIPGDAAQQLEGADICPLLLILLGKKIGAVHVVLSVEVPFKLKTLFHNQAVVEHESFLLSAMKEVEEDQFGSTVRILGPMLQKLTVVEFSGRALENSVHPIVFLSFRRVGEGFVGLNEDTNVLLRILAVLEEIRMLFLHLLAKGSFDILNGGGRLEIEYCVIVGQVGPVDTDHSMANVAYLG
jgi:hypothetical protein